MTNKSTRFLFVCTFVISLFYWLPGNSQTGSLSPYSRYGVGDLMQEGFTHQSGMGGIGAAISSPTNVNFINPASYIADSTTIFEFGARGEIRQLSYGDLKNTLNSASFSHFSLAFPIKKNRMSAAFGLLPYSSVGYNIQIDDADVPNIGTVRYKFEGTGGFNKVFLGTGIKLSKSFSAGINASYLFGTIQNIKSIEFPFNTNYYNSRYINGVTAGGFYFNYGILYQKPLKKEWMLKAGFTGSLSTNIKATNNQFYYNYIISSFGGEIVKDSIFNESTETGKIKLPDYFRFGISVNKSAAWMAGVDFSYQNWENYKNFNSTDTLSNSFTINAGGEHRTKKLVYRLGGRYSKTYLNLKETQLNDYAVTIGIGLQKLLPKRPPSSINLAIELGERGTLDNNLVKEQYIRFHLGFTLTDSWFMRPKYD